MQQENAPTYLREQGAVFPFFVVALAWTWLFQLPAVLAKFGLLSGGIERYFLPAMLGGFGPIVASLVVSYVESKGSGIRRRLASLRVWRVGVHWYLISFFVFTAIAVFGNAIYSVVSPESPLRWFHFPENAQHLSAMILMPIVEEPGWRGVALPRLQSRFCWLASSLILGVVWASWHAMMWILQGLSATTFAIAFINVVAGSIVFSWIFNRTRGSLLIALVAHAGVHLNNPFRAPGGAVQPLAIYTAAMVAAALVLIFARVKRL